MKLLLSCLLGFISFLNGESLTLLPCVNNGTLTRENGKLVCLCPHPFTGRLCEDYDCVNGLSTGDQYDADSLFFNKRCLCDAGWTGELCDTSIINRCGENGREDKGKCICNRNFVGDRCQYVAKCKHGQLYNGRCACHYGWTGNFCDKIFCHHGEPDEMNKKCICPAQYRGTYCDFCADHASSPPPECASIDGRRPIQLDGEHFLIFATVVIIMVFIVLGVGCYLMLYKNSQSKRAAKTARQTTADAESTSLGHTKEMHPLHSSNRTTGEEGTSISEKFYDAPPPSYDTIIRHQKHNMNRVRFNIDCSTPDSAFDESSGNSDEIDSSSATSLEATKKDMGNKIACGTQDLRENNAVVESHKEHDSFAILCDKKTSLSECSGQQQTIAKKLAYANEEEEKIQQANDDVIHLAVHMTNKSEKAEIKN